MEEYVKHLAEYSVVHLQFHNVKNVTTREETRIGNWIWTKIWKHDQKRNNPSFCDFKKNDNKMKRNEN